jgi:hypothetical protein
VFKDLGANKQKMKRQVNNLLFLFSFMFALLIGRTNYVQFGKSLLTEVHSKYVTFSKSHKEEKTIAEQNNYNKALPSETYVNAHQDFNDGKYINKNFISQRVAGGLINGDGAVITAATNHGRDGP